MLAVVRIIKGPGRARWAVLLVIPIAHFYLISKQQLVYGRYLLPMVPMLCLLAAMAVVSGVSLLRRYEIPRGPRAALIAMLTAAALVHPAYASIKFDQLIGRRDTTRMAYDWIQQNIPPGSIIVLETRELLLPPTYQSENIAQLRSHTYEEYQARGVQYLVASGECTACTWRTRSSTPPGTHSTCGSSSRAVSSFASSLHRMAGRCRDRSFGSTGWGPPLPLPRHRTTPRA